jgi:cell cycle sensor histidine kinase DivJ
VGLFTLIRGHVDALVHPSALRDPLAVARHRAFIAPRLVGSLVALAAFPAYLVVRGVPSVLEVVVFSWLIAPILTAYYLSRTGRYESAHVLSSLALTSLVTIVALMTGGISSFAAIWLVVVPLEAALSASRRVVAVASTMALIAAGLLVVCDVNQWMPAQLAEDQRQGALAALGIISAALYATGLALGVESLARTSFWLLYAEEDRYRLLARNMTDIITRHGANGAALFVSPAAEALFEIPATDLLGHGLFDRVHVADRPAYLSALGDAIANNDARSVEFRVRKDGRDSAGRTTVSFLWLEMRPPRYRRRRGRCRDAGHHRAQGAGGSAGGGAGGSRTRQRIEGALPRDHESRIAHAAQCHHRLLGNVAAGERPPDRRRAPRRLRQADQRLGPPSPVGGQWHSRHVEDRQR